MSPLKARRRLDWLTSAFQPRRLMIAPLADGCKRRLDRVPLRFRNRQGDDLCPGKSLTW